MATIDDIGFKTKVKVNNQEFDLEIVKADVKTIKLNNDLFVLNNDVKQNNETNILTEKKCIRCKQVKPITEFYRNKNHITGHQIYCKKCSYLINKEHKRKHQKKKLKSSSKKNKPNLENTVFIQWIDKKGKNSFTVDDFLEQHPECDRTKDRIDYQITELIKFKRIIQLGPNKFRRNI